jgi:hypothetical protein
MQAAIDRGKIQRWQVARLRETWPPLYTGEADE